MVKGWFEESRRHKLARLGIKTGRKSLPQHPLISTKGNSMFFPKKDTEKITVEQPITSIKSVGEISVGKKLDYVKESEIKAFEKGILSPKKRTKLISDFAGEIKDFEAGKLTGRETVRLFSHLERTGQITRFGSKYIVISTGLMKEGYLSKEGKILSKGLKKGLKFNYPKDNRGKKIVTGALIGATVGALAYKKGNPVSKKARYAFDEPIKTGKYKGLKPRYTFVNNKVVEIIYFKGKKKMFVKKLDYPENNVEDITIKTQIEGVDITKKPVEEGMEVSKEVGKKGFKERAKAVGRGIKTGFEKGQELTEKLRVMKQEKEIRDLEKSQKKLLSLKTKLQVAQTKEQIESAKERIRKVSPSLLQDVLGAPKKEPKKEFKSIFD